MSVCVVLTTPKEVLGVLSMSMSTPSVSFLNILEVGVHSNLL